jgi:hypothetical protein
MARKRTKGRNVTKTRKAVKKPRKPASKNAAAKRELPGTVDLLRSWSPSRYSTR